MKIKDLEEINDIKLKKIKEKGLLEVDLENIEQYIINILYSIETSQKLPKKGVLLRYKKLKEVLQDKRNIKNRINELNIIIKEMNHLIYNIKLKIKI